MRKYIGTCKAEKWVTKYISMDNYLTKEQLKANLKLGKTVEQWLGYYEIEDETILKWVNIYSDKGNYFVMYIECYDQGDFDNLDISDFTVVDPDEPYGLIKSMNNLDEAIEFSIEAYGAQIDKFVNSGMIETEYLAYLNNK